MISIISLGILCIIVILKDGIGGSSYVKLRAGRPTVYTYSDQLILHPLVIMAIPQSRNEHIFHVAITHVYVAGSKMFLF